MFTSTFGPMYSPARQHAFGPFLSIHSVEKNRSEQPGAQYYICFQNAQHLAIRGGEGNFKL